MSKSSASKNVGHTHKVYAYWISFAAPLFLFLKNNL